MPDALDLFTPCRLEIHILLGQAQSISLKKAIALHPGHSGLPEVGSCLVKAGVLCLMTDDVHRNFVLFAEFKKRLHTIYQSGLSHPWSVHAGL